MSAGGRWLGRPKAAPVPEEEETEEWDLGDVSIWDLLRVIGQLEDLENPKASFTLTSSELELAPGKGDALRDVEVKGTLSLPKAGPRVQAKLHSPGGTIAICVLTSDNKDRRWDVDNAGKETPCLCLPAPWS